MFKPHEWGSDPEKEARGTVCMQCDQPFIEVGGTACPGPFESRVATEPVPIVHPPAKASWYGGLWWMSLLLAAAALTFIVGLYFGAKQ